MPLDQTQVTPGQVHLLQIEQLGLCEAIVGYRLNLIATKVQELGAPIQRLRDVGKVGVKAQDGLLAALPLALAHRRALGPQLAQLAAAAQQPQQQVEQVEPLERLVERRAGSQGRVQAPLGAWPFSPHLRGQRAALGAVVAGYVLTTGRTRSLQRRGCSSRCHRILELE